jgi:para-nitrobenzyl esterase
MKFMFVCARLLAAVALAAAVSACGGGEADAPLGPQVQTLSGRIAGAAAGAADVLAFKGIPYAAPPTGALRWKEPQPVAPWSGTRDATRFGARCWAATAFGGPVRTEGVSEDCLTLNVWSPAKTRGAALPVMVWIHGGGFQFASSADALYDGASLARNGVVVVTLNYRLGVFGFLSRPDLDVESGGHGSGMYGMLDQVAALRWVRDNIAAFGGDPRNVTLFGESAGAHAVGMLMASPLTTGLFHKAIGQSGAFWESEMKTRAQAQASGLALGRELGAEDLQQLRSVDALRLQTATDWTLAMPTRFSPTVDGYVLRELPYAAFAAGRQQDGPLLAGWNADEGIPFMAYSLPHATPQAFSDAAAATFGAANLADFLRLYPAATPGASAQALEGDLTIKHQTWSWLVQQRKTGRSPVWGYRFAYVSPFDPVPTHLSEVQFVFGNLLGNALPGLPAPAAPSAADRAVSQAMQAYWTNFARSGDPNGSGLPAWPRYEGAGTQVLQFGATPAAAPEEGTARFQFLDRFRINGLMTVGQH